MGIVSAGMHHPIHLRDEGVVVLLLYGQGVHVGPQRDGPARPAPFHYPKHARPGITRGKWNVVLTQLLLHHLRSCVFLPAQLGMLVKMAP